MGDFGITGRIAAVIAAILAGLVAAYLYTAILRWDEVAEIVRNLRALVG